MGKKHEVSCKRFVSLIAIAVGVGYVAAIGSLVRQALSIIAAVNKGLIPGIALALVGAGILAWLAGWLCR